MKTYRNISNQCYNKEGLHATSDVLGSNFKIFIGDTKTSIGPEQKCKWEISHDEKLVFESILGDGACCFNTIITAFGLNMNVESLKETLEWSGFRAYFAPEIDEELMEVQWGGLSSICLAALEFNKNVCIHLQGYETRCLYVKNP